MNGKVPFTSASVFNNAFLIEASFNKVVIKIAFCKCNSIVKFKINICCTSNKRLHNLNFQLLYMFYKLTAFSVIQTNM